MIYLDKYEMKQDLLWWQERGLMYTSTGYGKKIPTTNKVHFAGRWRRIYCSIYSNIGTCFIIYEGKELTVS